MQVGELDIDPSNPSNLHLFRAFDYVYAVNYCLSLAKGTFTTESRYPTPRKGPLCPDASNKAVEGVCNAEFSSKNADSINLVSTSKTEPFNIASR